MSNAAVSFIGAANGVDATTDEQRALYLKIFSGEVIVNFEKTTVCLDKHSIRTIQSGKSAQFPLIGRMPSAEYHTPGQEILGQEIKQNERVIAIDKLLINHVFLADIDEAMAHFEVRSKYSSRMGASLAQTFDNHVMREVAIAAAASSNVGEDDGYEITNADFDSGTSATRLDAWVDSLFLCAENFDNKFVPGKRWSLMKPADYYFFVKEVSTNGFSAIHRDIGGEGSFADGKIISIGGIALVSTPMLPTANYSGEDYHAKDLSLLKSLVFTEDAVGTVKLMDIAMQSQWDIRRQGTLMVARYAMGHGILQPECASALYDTA